MSFDEIFPDIGEKGFRHVQATELRSGVFWQEPDGRFSFEAFPPYAQSGRIMDFVIEDVDGDGRRDLLLSLDGVTLEAWSDRIEKGQLGLLLNRGDRRFESVLPWTSGLVIDGSPRGMAWGDLDGDGSPELIVMLNEAMPLVFSLSRTASP
jgi:hypothetical protein